MREARVHLREDDIRRLGLTDLLASAREVGLERLTELLTEGRGRLYHVQVQDRLPQATLNGAANLQWWERLSDSSDGGTYLWKVRQPAGDTGMRAALNDRTRDSGMGSTQTVELCIMGPQDALDLSPVAHPEEGIHPHLERITEYRAPPSPLEHLTDRQLEVVEEAYRSGYFEVPRQASAKDVATRLSVDPSTVAEHLQRAERNLVNALFSDID